MAEIRQWPGLMSDVDPHDHAGARVQDNCQSLSPGKLTGRRGTREVWFENASARGGGAVSDITTLPDILAITSFNRPEGEYVVFMDDAGTIMAGRAAT